MQDVEIIGMLKTYVAKSLVGAGALKGAPCTITSITHDDENHVTDVVFKWTDDNGDPQTATMTVPDGAQGETGETGATGATGADGSDGFSPTITVKTSTDSTYVLTITTADDSFDTPNLKGSGAGVDSISVNGVEQTISGGAVDLDVATNLITEDQWTAIEAALT